MQYTTEFAMLHRYEHDILNAQRELARRDFEAEDSLSSVSETARVETPRTHHRLGRLRLSLR